MREHKPYWNDKLTSLWKIMRKHEQEFLKSKAAKGHEKKRQREQYKNHSIHLIERYHFMNGYTAKISQ